MLFFIALIGFISLIETKKDNQNSVELFGDLLK